MGVKPWSLKATLAMEVSGYCNLCCPMCSYPNMKRKHGFMDWNLFKKIVEDAAANGHSIASLHFFGEPLMWPYIVQGVELLAKNNIFPRISTNGMLLTSQMAKRLEEAGLKEIMVTIDTLMPKVYSKIRKGGDFEIVKKNIHESLEVTDKLLISAQFMPTNENADETQEDFYKEFGYKKNFRVEPWFLIRMNNSENIATKYTHKPEDVDKRLCDKIFDRVDVLWDGTTVLCCLDVEGKLITGNLNDNSISYSWLGPKAMNLRKLILNGQWTKLSTCRECSADHIVDSINCWRVCNPPNKLPPKYKKLLKAVESLGNFANDDERSCDS